MKILAGQTTEAPRITNAVRLEAIGGTVRIGVAAKMAAHETRTAAISNNIDVHDAEPTQDETIASGGFLTPGIIRSIPFTGRSPQLTQRLQNTSGGLRGGGSTNQATNDRRGRRSRIVRRSHTVSRAYRGAAAALVKYLKPGESIVIPLTAPEPINPSSLRVIPQTLADQVEARLTDSGQRETAPHTYTIILEPTSPWPTIPFTFQAQGFTENGQRIQSATVTCVAIYNSWPK